jgi:hypothetical protein
MHPCYPVQSHRAPLLVSAVNLAPGPHPKREPPGAGAGAVSRSNYQKQKKRKTGADLLQAT